MVKKPYKIYQYSEQARINTSVIFGLGIVIGILTIVIPLSVSFNIKTLEDFWVFDVLSLILIFVSLYFIVEAFKFRLGTSVQKNSGDSFTRYENNSANSFSELRFSLKLRFFIFFVVGVSLGVLVSTTPKIILVNIFPNVYEDHRFLFSLFLVPSEMILGVCLLWFIVYSFLKIKIYLICLSEKEMVKIEGYLKIVKLMVRKSYGMGSRSKLLMVNCGKV